MKKGRCGTTTLLVALTLLDGEIIGSCMTHHRHQEFIRLLRKINAETAASLNLGLTLDNYSTHKHSDVRRWARRHPRVHLHYFIPTSNSWLNTVEHWFRDLTERRIRRRVFHSVRKLIQAIEEYLRHHNVAPKPLIWTKSAQDVLAKTHRAMIANG